MASAKRNDESIQQQPEQALVSHEQRDIQELAPAGILFKCNSATLEAVEDRMLLGAPEDNLDLVRRVKPGTTVFILDVELKELHTGFEAASEGRREIEHLVRKPNASSSRNEVDTAGSDHLKPGSSERTDHHQETEEEEEEDGIRLTAQIRIRRVRRCAPMSCKQFRPILSTKFSEHVLWDESKCAFLDRETVETLRAWRTPSDSGRIRHRPQKKRNSGANRSSPKHNSGAQNHHEQRFQQADFSEKQGPSKIKMQQQGTAEASEDSIEKTPSYRSNNSHDNNWRTAERSFPHRDFRRNMNSSTRVQGSGFRPTVAMTALCAEGVDSAGSSSSDDSPESETSSVSSVNTNEDSGYHSGVSSATNGTGPSDNPRSKQLSEEVEGVDLKQVEKNSSDSGAADKADILPVPSTSSANQRLRKSLSIVVEEADQATVSYLKPVNECIDKFLENVIKAMNVRQRATSADPENHEYDMSGYSGDDATLIWRRIEEVVRNIYGSAVVQIYGSFATGLWLPGQSDLDLLITLHHGHALMHGYGRMRAGSASGPFLPRGSFDGSSIALMRSMSLTTMASPKAGTSAAKTPDEHPDDQVNVDESKPGIQTSSGSLNAGDTDMSEQITEAQAVEDNSSDGSDVSESSLGQFEPSTSAAPVPVASSEGTSWAALARRTTSTTTHECETDNADPAAAPNSTAQGRSENDERTPVMQTLVRQAPLSNSKLQQHHQSTLLEPRISLPPQMQSSMPAPAPAPTPVSAPTPAPMPIAASPATATHQSIGTQSAQTGGQLTGQWLVSGVPAAAAAAAAVPPSPAHVATSTSAPVPTPRGHPPLHPKTKASETQTPSQSRVNAQVQTGNTSTPPHMMYPFTPEQMYSFMPSFFPFADPNADVGLDRGQLLTYMCAVHSALKAQPWCKSIKLIKSSSMPVIKMNAVNLLSNGTPTGPEIPVDISFRTNDHYGLQARDFVLQLTDDLSGVLRPLVLILKRLLREYDLHDVYKGGLGSYTLTTLVVFFLLRVGFVLTNEMPRIAPALLSPQHMAAIVAAQQQQQPHPVAVATGVTPTSSEGEIRGRTSSDAATTPSGNNEERQNGSDASAQLQQEGQSHQGVSKPAQMSPMPGGPPSPANTPPFMGSSLQQPLHPRPRFPKVDVGGIPPLYQDDSDEQEEEETVEHVSSSKAEILEKAAQVVECSTRESRSWLNDYVQSGCKGKVNVGVLLMGFLQMYSRPARGGLDLEQLELSILNRGSVRVQRRRRDADGLMQQPQPLCVRDPVRPSHCLGSGSFNMYMVQQRFGQLRDLLMHRPSQLYDLLAMDINPDAAQRSPSSAPLPGMPPGMMAQPGFGPMAPYQGISGFVPFIPVGFSPQMMSLPMQLVSPMGYMPPPGTPANFSGTFNVATASGQLPSPRDTSSMSTHGNGQTPRSSLTNDRPTVDDPRSNKDGKGDLKPLNHARTSKTRTSSIDSADFNSTSASTTMNPNGSNNGNAHTSRGGNSRRPRRKPSEDSRKRPASVSTDGEKSPQQGPLPRANPSTSFSSTDTYSKDNSNFSASSSPAGSPQMHPSGVYMHPMAESIPTNGALPHGYPMQMQFGYHPSMGFPQGYTFPSGYPQPLPNPTRLTQDQVSSTKQQPHKLNSRLSGDEPSNTLATLGHENATGPNSSNSNSNSNGTNGNHNLNHTHNSGSKSRGQQMNHSTQTVAPQVKGTQTQYPYMTPWMWSGAPMPATSDMSHTNAMAARMPEEGHTIVARNIPYEASPEDFAALEEKFRSYGKVLYSTHSAARGSLYITYATEREARRAISKMQGHQIMDRELRIKFYRDLVQDYQFAFPRPFFPAPYSA